MEQMNNKPDIPPRHLWEYNIDTFNFDRSYKIVIERVSERGDLAEWSGILRYYGEKKIAEVVEWGAQRSKRDKAFARFFLKSDLLHTPIQHQK